MNDRDAREPLIARAVSAGYGGQPVVDAVSLALRPGEVLAIIGPNGSGKSTLLRTLARLHTPSAGAVLLDEQAIADLPTRTVARRLAFLPQDPVAPPGLTVRELVGLGRHPHRRWFGGDADGARAVDEALRATDVDDLAERGVESLSGGQRQRVWIALALAQGARLLLLDEPTNHLDPAHRAEVMSTLLRLAHAGGHSVAVVLHDLVLAAGACDRIAVLDRGRVVALGSPDEALRPELLSRVYGTDFDLLTDPRSGRPVPLQRLVTAHRAGPDPAHLTEKPT